MLVLVTEAIPWSGLGISAQVGISSPSFGARMQFSDGFMCGQICRVYRASIRAECIRLLDCGHGLKYHFLNLYVVVPMHSAAICERISFCLFLASSYVMRMNRFLTSRHSVRTAPCAPRRNLQSCIAKGGENREIAMSPFRRPRRVACLPLRNKQRRDVILRRIFLAKKVNS